MGSSDDKSWHERIAERAHGAWESEGRRPGRDREHWHQAEAGLWAELLAVPRDLAHQANRMRSGLTEGTDDGLLRAAEIGCEAMRFLVRRAEFANVLRKKSFTGRTPRPGLSPDAFTMLKDQWLFDDFLDVERQVLRRAELDPVLVNQVLGYCRQWHTDVDGFFTESYTADRHVLDVAEFRACEAVEIIRARIAQVRQRLSERRKSRGVLFSLAADVMVLANGVCGSVIGMPMPELSEALGSAVFGAAFSPFFL
jgi:hypothetical protein